jgi:murein DD-endopeptidase MepM/ murein hydrolase activator NlpD
LLIEKNIEFKLPLKKGRLTSGFGIHINPFTQEEAFHHAIDIASPQGTPVYSAAQGLVVVADSIKGHGNRIILQHVQDFTTYYSHLYKILVNENQIVNAGDKIGLVGNTGLSTAPHLHFEIRNKKEALNPSEFLDLSIYKKK